ncbi:hypothetical protein Asal01_00258 [Fodinibius salicampi]
MLKKVIPLLLLFLQSLASIPAVYSQPIGSTASNMDIPVQSIYLELGGPGSIYTANYDAIFDSGWGFRIGGAYLPEETYRSQSTGNSYFGTDLLVILLMGEYVTGEGPHKFESSFGIMLGESNITNIDVSVPDPPGLAASFGYRYLPKEAGKLTFKAAFTPVIAKGHIYPKIGVSIGFILPSE